MKKKDERELMVGLDIGTSKVAAVVGEFDDQGRLNIMGYGMAKSQGLNRGTVVNIDSTVQSIRKAIEEAEIMAGCQINNTYTGIADRHITSINSEGMVPIRDREVTMADVHRVMDAAKTVALPPDQQILHILPKEFKIDNEDKIREPLGMSGVRLEAKVHMITGAISAAQNIAKCVKRCGLQVNDIILDQLAASCALLTDDEKELGVCLIDIGAGKTNVLVFAQGAIQYACVIPVGGDQVTNDIAIAFRMPSHQAEKIKISYGQTLQSFADANLLIEVAGLANRPAQTLSQLQLASVIQPRYEEILEWVREELQKRHLDKVLNAGIVLTGGAAQTAGMMELTESYFNTSVRLGVPQRTIGLQDILTNPIYATSIGLLMYAEQQKRSARTTRPRHEGVKGVFGRIKNWVQGNF